MILFGLEGLAVTGDSVWTKQALALTHAAVSVKPFFSCVTDPT